MGIRSRARTAGVFAEFVSVPVGFQSQILRRENLEDWQAGYKISKIKSPHQRTLFL